MTTPNPLVVDHATPILNDEPALSDEHKEALWDAFHASKSPNELAKILQPLAIPNDTKQKLFDAKRASIPPAVEPLDKTTAAIKQMGEIDKDTLDLAETHPNVLKALSAAATAAEKGPESPAGERSAAPKGEKSAAAETPATLAQPPRPDGLPHLPPIPAGHHRILASDGGIHDVPAENIEAVRAIDPNLHVMNP